MTIEEDEALATPEYWDSRYATGDGHEWFRSFKDLEPFLEEKLFKADGLKPADNPLILHLGSGDSHVPEEFATRGYAQQLCVDFSPTVVQQMTEKHASIRGITWSQKDVTKMDEFPDATVDFAFDKGTLDAMIHGNPWNPPDDVKDLSRRYMEEVHRVLKYHGEFIIITFRQPWFVEPLLDPEDKLWSRVTHKLGGDNGTFYYYAHVLTKRAHHSTPTPPA